MPISRIFLCSALLFLPNMYGLGQKIDGRELKEDKETVDSIYLTKAWVLREEFPDSTIFYSNLQQEIAEKINYKLGAINTHYVRGIAYNQKRYFDKAVNEFYMGLSYIKESKDYENLRKKSLILQGLGVAYAETNDYETAFEIYKEGLEIAVIINCKHSIADLNYNLGNCYRKKGDLEKSINQFNIAREIYLEMDKYEDVADVYNVVGFIYHKKKKYELAREHFSNSLLTLKQHGISTSRKAWYTLNIGETYFAQHDYESAIRYYLEALRVGTEFNDLEKIKLITNNLGDVSFKQGNYREAITYYEKCVALSNPESNTIDTELQRAYQSIMEAHKHLGNYKEAMEYMETFVGQSQIVNEQVKLLTEQNAQHKVREVEWQNQLADETMKTTQQRFLSAAIALGFSLMVLLYVVVKGNKMVKE